MASTGSIIHFIGGMAIKIGDRVDLRVVCKMECAIPPAHDTGHHAKHSFTPTVKDIRISATDPTVLELVYDDECSGGCGDTYCGWYKHVIRFRIPAAKVPLPLAEKKDEKKDTKTAETATATPPPPEVVRGAVVTSPKPVHSGDKRKSTHTGSGAKELYAVVTETVSDSGKNAFSSGAALEWVSAGRPVDKKELDASILATHELDGFTLVSMPCSAFENEAEEAATWSIQYKIWVFDTQESADKAKDVANSALESLTNGEQPEDRDTRVFRLDFAKTAIVKKKR